MPQNGKEIYDFIIVGAGPAGLSIGSELSKKYSGLIIEKGRAGDTDRSWFVPLNVVDDDVKPYTFGGVSRFLTNTYTGSNISWNAKQFDRYPYVNEHAILPHWADKVRKNGSVILDNCEFRDLDVKKGIVTAKTDKGSFRARLLIDASGCDSPVINKYKIKRGNLYWWSVYGAIGKHPRGLEEGLQVGDYMLWQTFKETNLHGEASLAEGRPVFEYEILDRERSFTLILYLRQKRMDKEFMKKEFYDIIRNEASTSVFHDLQIIEDKFGWYPSGDISHQQIARDHVVFVGDAGCWTTPCGWGMGFILGNYKEFSKEIGGALDRNELDRKSLMRLSLFATHEKYEILLNALATHFLAHASVSLLDRFIQLFDKDVDPVICEKLFTLSISEEEVIEVLPVVMSKFSLLELWRIIPKNDYPLIGQLLKYFLKDMWHRFLRALGFMKDKKPSKTDSGFDFNDR